MRFSSLKTLLKRRPKGGPRLPLGFRGWAIRVGVASLLLFLVVSAGSLSIGAKSLLVSQTLIMMFALSQRREQPRASIFQTLAMSNDNPVSLRNSSP